MKILSVDTATEACSAALNIEGEIHSIFELAPREHTRLILSMVQSLLDKAGIQINDLDALAFGRGPGSFTGVRIATGVVHGLAFAADLPVIPVSTLASIAQSSYLDHSHANVVAGIDARMGGMYWGCYQLAENGLMQLSGYEHVNSPEDVELPEGKWCGAGSAWGAYDLVLQQKLADCLLTTYPEYLPDAASMAQLAAYEFQQNNLLDAAQAQPVYLRNDVAKKAVRTI